MATPLTIDTIAKLVIQPIPCDWNGCAATINSWFTLQKVCELLWVLIYNTSKSVCLKPNLAYIFSFLSGAL
jgi:hypothetical protein